LSAGDIARHLRTLRALGVPYSDEMIAEAAADLEAQARPDADTSGLLRRYPRAVVGNFDGNPELTELDALIAYLQVLGTMVDFTTYRPEYSAAGQSPP